MRVLNNYNHTELRVTIQAIMPSNISPAISALEPLVRRHHELNASTPVLTSVLDLTIAIPVRNEERNLPGCLTAIGEGFAAYTLVIDSGSTDRTGDIAKEFGAEVVDFNWDGQFPKKRNWFLRNYAIKTKWILFLDADEYLTPAFKEELRTKLDQDGKVGYWLSYTVYFLGKQLKGGYPLRKLALFRVGAGEYEHIEENHWSHLDMEVHEHPVLTGEIGHIRSKIDHQDFRGVAHHVAKHSDYATWEAARFAHYWRTYRHVSTWTWKQRLKYKLLNSVFFSPIYFFGSFFLLGGFRDGRVGLAHVILKMAYFTEVYCKIREKERK